MEHEHDEDKLLAVARAGDRDAFGELIKRHSDRVLRTTRRITKHREDAEDAAQESMTNAFVQLRSFNGASRFSTWLTRIAINAALMTLRKKRLSREVPMEEPREQREATCYHEAMDAALNPEEWYAERERSMILSEAVFRLRPTLRETLEVHQKEMRSVRATAEILGISNEAAKGRLFHARAALRKQLQIRAIFERNPRAGGFSRPRGRTESSCHLQGNTEFPFAEMNEVTSIAKQRSRCGDLAGDL